MGEVEAILVTAILAAFVAFASVHTQRVITRRGHTLDYLSRVDNDKDMIAARRKFVEITQGNGDLLAYARRTNFNSDGAEALRLVLNENERLAIGIQFGVLDEKIIRRHCRKRLIRDWELAAPFIESLRSEINNIAIYHEFQDLMKRFSEDSPPPRWYWLRLWF